MTVDSLPRIDRNSPTPIYKQIQDWMRSRIVSGAWPEYFQLPSEVDLAAQIRVNRGTLRNAIQHLVDEGLFIRIHGKGTFVAANAVQQPLAASLTTFSESLDAQKIPFETKVRASRRSQADLVVAPLLSIEPGSPIFYLERVRTVKGQTIVFLKNYIPYSLVKDIEKVDFTSNRLFKVLETQFKIQIAWGRRYFEARIANAEVAQALDVAEGAPIMYAKQISYQSDGKPLEMSDIWFVGQHFRLSAVVNRKNALSILSGVPEVMHTEFNINLDGGLYVN